MPDGNAARMDKQEKVLEPLSLLLAEVERAQARRDVELQMHLARIAGTMLGGALCGMAVQAPVFLGVPTTWQFPMTGLVLMGSVTGITLVLLLHPGPETPGHARCSYTA